LYIALIAGAHFAVQGNFPFNNVGPGFILAFSHKDRKMCKTILPLRRIQLKNRSIWICLL
jgi:hypothetical protein